MDTTIYLVLLDAVMMVVMSSMGRDYVSELRPPVGLLFIPQVVHEHGEPWCMLTGENSPIHPPECSLAILPAEPSSKSGGSRWTECWLLSTKYFFQTGSSYTCCKMLRLGVSGFTSSVKEYVLLPSRIHHLSQAWTCKPWVQWQKH
jgi:hypothetical protein